ncbi:hypothetical protein K1886_000642 [Listeria monocytogenes]|nr:hypothetical protein [Listeria monocytogenes]EHX3816449.1 hypothetical protein [Listeria monocytogenes]
MREIKFRAWDKDGKLYTDEEVSIVRGHFVKSSYTASWWMEEAELIHGTQYTGLKDKSDNNIFEGDIVDISVYDRLDWSSIKGKVVFLNGAWLVVDVGHFAITLQSETNEIEIIGNVHENLGLWEA